MSDMPSFEINGIPLVRVQWLRDAQYAICRECGQTFPNVPAPWKLSSSKWLHENGTGHRVDYYAFSVDWLSSHKADLANTE